MPNNAENHALGNGWRGLLADAAIRQGPSFLLLVAILWWLSSFVERAVPKHLEEIQAGYERIQTSQDNNLKLILDSTDRREKLLRESVEDFRDALKNLQDRPTG